MALSAPANVPHHASSCLQPQLRTESLALPFTSRLGSQDSRHTMISEWITEGKGRRVACLNRNFAGLSKGTLLRIKNCHYSRKGIKIYMPKLLSLFRAQCLESLCHPPVSSLHTKRGHSGLLVWEFGVLFLVWFFFKKKPQNFQDPRS